MLRGRFQMRPYMVAASVVLGTWLFCSILMGSGWPQSSTPESPPAAPSEMKEDPQTPTQPSQPTPTQPTQPKSDNEANTERYEEKNEKEVPYDHVLFFIERFESTMSHAKRGGPFGEVLLYQSAEQALLSLGLNVSFLQEKHELRNEVIQLMRKNEKFLVFSCEYSLKNALEVLREEGVSLCILRLLGFWGTPPEQNHLKINPKQYLVPYPNPWNTFLGLDIQGRMVSKEGETIQKESCGVVWGKEPKYFDAAMDWLLPLTKNVELHTTIRDECFYVADETERIKEFVLSGNVINHGIIRSKEFHELLAKCRFFLGLGDPILGPSALEALSEGCAYINPVFSEPKSISDIPKHAMRSQHDYLLGRSDLDGSMVFNVKHGDGLALRKTVDRLVSSEFENMDVTLLDDFRAESIAKRLFEHLKLDMC